MTLFIEHKSIDKEQWDRAIDHSLCARPYLFSWYLDIVAPGWGAIADKAYHFMAPLPLRRKAGLTYVFQPRWVQQLGFYKQDCSNTDENLIKEQIGNLPAKLVYLHYNLNETNECKNAVTHDNYCLMLNNEYDRIRKSYSQNLKRNLKKAEQNDIYISDDIDPETLINTFRNNAGKQLKKITDRDYQCLQTIIREGVAKGKVQTKGVFNEAGRYLGGAVFLESSYISVLLFSSLTSQGREKAAMPLLIDNYIREQAGNNRLLDFEGSDNNSLARFYKSFGAKNHPYPEIKWARSPLFPKPLSLQKAQ